MGILMSREHDGKRMRLIEEKLGINNNHLSPLQKYSIFYNNNKEIMKRFHEVERKLNDKCQVMETQILNMTKVFEVLTNEGRIKQILENSQAGIKS